jgi:hypothetical protein
MISAFHPIATGERTSLEVRFVPTTEETDRIVKEDSVPHLYSGGAHLKDRRSGLSISFMMRSKGGGTTSAKVRVEAWEFKLLAAAMMDAAPKEAERAFPQVLIAHSKRRKK